MSLARRVFPMILGLVLTCVAGREIAAHALVVESSPTVDGSVRGPEIELRATASGLRPGTYKLRWQVLAIDGHITRGDIPFRVTTP